VNILKNIAIILLLLIVSCSGKEEKQKEESKTDTTTDLEIQAKAEMLTALDYDMFAEEFAKEVLKENFRKHSFDMADLKKPVHSQIFENVGIQKIEAYSNKNYPKTSEPNYYEHFILFMATYDTPEHAIKTFNRIKADSKKTFKEWQPLDKEVSLRALALNRGAKPGGMIIQRGEHIFSLVKTCRETPIGGNWKDYENKFLQHITERDEEIEVLNAYCGMEKYKIEKIIATRQDTLY